jgi:hypothetical protein
MQPCATGHSERSEESSLFPARCQLFPALNMTNKTNSPLRHTP